MNGLILLPSYQRAGLCERFFDAYRATGAETPGLLIVDIEDPQLEQYKKLKAPDGWTLQITKARTMGAKFRETWDLYAEKDFVIILNDDHVPVTKGWDHAVISQLNGSNCVFTNDGVAPDKPYAFPHRICGAIGISGGIYRTLGYLFPNELDHLFTDDVWAHLFNGAQCAMGLPDVCVEHRHAYLHQAEQDDTFREINGPGGLNPQTRQGDGGLWPKDRERFTEWFQNSSADDMRKLVAIQPKAGLMVATPSHDGNCSLGYALGLTDLSAFCLQHGVYFEMARVTGSSLIPHARNSLADMFLKSKCQKMLFVDADQQWDKNAALRLFNSSRRIVAGVTPHKRFPINLNFDPIEKHKKYFKDLNNKSVEEYYEFVAAEADIVGEVEVSRSGTGFLMIDRSVFELMREHVAEYFPFDNNDKDTHLEFFKMGSEASSKRFRGEDWFFMELAKKLHIPIFINTRALVAHQGSYTWGMDILPGLEGAVAAAKAKNPKAVAKPELRPA